MPMAMCTLDCRKMRTPTLVLKETRQASTLVDPPKAKQTSMSTAMLRSGSQLLLAPMTVSSKHKDLLEPLHLLVRAPVLMGRLANLELVLATTHTLVRGRVPTPKGPS